jgi:hypothetical protein
MRQKKLLNMFNWMDNASAIALFYAFTVLSMFACSFILKSDEKYDESEESE